MIDINADDSLRIGQELTAAIWRHPSIGYRLKRVDTLRQVREIFRDLRSKERDSFQYVPGKQMFLIEAILHVANYYSGSDHDGPEAQWSVLKNELLSFAIDR